MIGPNDPLPQRNPSPIDPAGAIEAFDGFAAAKRPPTRDEVDPATGRPPGISAFGDQRVRVPGATLTDLPDGPQHGRPARSGDSDGFPDRDGGSFPARSDGGAYSARSADTSGYSAPNGDAGGFAARSGADGGESPQRGSTDSSGLPQRATADRSDEPSGLPQRGAEDRSGETSGFPLRGAGTGTFPTRRSDSGGFPVRGSDSGGFPVRRSGATPDAEPPVRTDLDPGQHGRPPFGQPPSADFPPGPAGAVQHGIDLPIRSQQAPYSPPPAYPAQQPSAQAPAGDSFSAFGNPPAEEIPPHPYRTAGTSPADPFGRGGDQPSGATPELAHGSSPDPFGRAAAGRATAETPDGSSRPASPFGVEPPARAQSPGPEAFGAAPPPTYGTPRSAPLGEAPSGSFGEAPSGPFGAAPSGSFGEATSGPFGEAPSGPFGEGPSGSFGEAPSGPFGATAGAAPTGSPATPGVAYGAPTSGPDSTGNPAYGAAPPDPADRPSFGPGTPGHAFGPGPDAVGGPSPEPTGGRFRLDADSGAFGAARPASPSVPTGEAPPSSGEPADAGPDDHTPHRRPEAPDGDGFGYPQRVPGAALGSGDAPVAADPHGGSVPQPRDPAEPSGSAVGSARPVTASASVPSASRAPVEAAEIPPPPATAQARVYGRPVPAETVDPSGEVAAAPPYDPGRRPPFGDNPAGFGSPAYPQRSTDPETPGGQPGVAGLAPQSPARATARAAASARVAPPGAAPTSPEQPPGGPPHAGPPPASPMQPHPGQAHPGQAHPGQAHPGQAHPGQASPAQAGPPHAEFTARPAGSRPGLPPEQYSELTTDIAGRPDSPYVPAPALPAMPPGVSGGYPPPGQPPGQPTPPGAEIRMGGVFPGPASRATVTPPGPDDTTNWPGPEQDKFDKFKAEADKTPDKPETPHVRVFPILITVVIAAVLLLGVVFGIAYLFAGDGKALTVTQGDCVKRDGSAAVKAGCSEAGAFEVVSVETDKAQCADPQQPYVVNPTGDGTSQVLCLKPRA